MAAAIATTKHEKRIASSASSAALKRYKEKTRSHAVAELGGGVAGALIDKQLAQMPNMLPKVPAAVPVLGGMPGHALIGGAVALKHALSPFKSVLGAGIAGAGGAMLIRNI